MAEEVKKTDEGDAEAQIEMQVAPSPHLSDRSLTTRGMMIDVLIALAPVIAVSLWVFRWYAVKQLGICVASCLAAEVIFTAMRRKPIRVGDCSAAVTGVILAMSLPGTAPWYAGVIGSFAAVGLGKIVFGSLGQNIFNPAMVGRAFVMIAFAAALGAEGYKFNVDKEATAARAPGAPIVYKNADLGVVDVLTKATPMTLRQEGEVTPLRSLALGGILSQPINGSLGEISAIACIVGGVILLGRRTAAWQIPLGMILAAGVIGGIVNVMNPGAQWTVAHDLTGGALLFGAFFIATDPVTSPLTSKGRFIFGLGIGTLVMLLRSLSAYPEGVMFAVLLMNAVVPLINRWTVPRPLGGPVPVKS